MKTLAQTLLTIAVVLVTWNWLHGQGWPPRNGSILPGTCATGESYWKSTDTSTELYRCTATNTWTLHDPAAAGGMPAGLVAFRLTDGACPSGWTEVAGLNARMLVGTLDANNDAGGTGGSDTITPAGTNSAPTFTGTAFTSIINHTHPVTDPGHNHIYPSQTATTGGATSYEHGTLDTSSAEAEATETTNTNTTGITTANPAGGVASITPTGTNSAPTFTGTSFDNRSAFTRAIFCSKD